MGCERHHTLGGHVRDLPSGEVRARVASIDARDASTRERLALALEPSSFLCPSSSHCSPREASTTRLPHWPAHRTPNLKLPVCRAASRTRRRHRCRPSRCRPVYPTRTSPRRTSRAHNGHGPLPVAPAILGPMVLSEVRSPANVRNLRLAYWTPANVEGSSNGAREERPSPPVTPNESGFPRCCRPS